MDSCTRFCFNLSQSCAVLDQNTLLYHRDDLGGNRDYHHPVPQTPPNGCCAFSSLPVVG